MEVLEDIYLKRKEYFENWKKYAEELKKLAKEFFKENFEKLIVFGPIIKNKYSVGLSDIDILIVLKEYKKEESIKFLVLVDKKFADNPFQIIICDKSKWENWYKKILDKYVEI